VLVRVVIIIIFVVFVVDDDGIGVSGGSDGGGGGGNLYYKLASEPHILSAKKTMLFSGTLLKICKILNSTSITIKQLTAKKRLPSLTTSNIKQRQINLSNSPYHITSPLCHSSIVPLPLPRNILINFIRREDAIIYIQGSLQYDVLLISKPFLHRNKITED
jgi:hypothetical protein